MIDGSSIEVGSVPVINGIEIGIREAPFSNTSQNVTEGGHSIFLSRERINPELIASTHLNPMLGDFLHPTVASQLNSESYLQERAYFTVPLKPNEKIKSPEKWGRAMPIGYGVIPYCDIVGGVIMVKGVSAAGMFYGKDTELHTDPIGFFGSKDASTEVEIANLLLQRGFRSGLPLGWLEFDNERLKEWLTEKWSESPIVKNSIINHIDTVSMNEDKCAMLFRICNSSERLSSVELGFSRFMPETPEQIAGRKQRLKTEIARSAKYMLAETQIFDDKLSSLLPFKPRKIKRLKEALGKISRKESISQKELSAYQDYLYALIDKNTKALKNLPPNKRLRLLIQDALNRPKDIDLGFVSMDFEPGESESFLTPATAKALINNDYNDSMKSYIDESYLPKVQKLGLIKIQTSP